MRADASAPFARLFLRFKPYFLHCISTKIFWWRWRSRYQHRNQEDPHKAFTCAIHVIFLFKFAALLLYARCVFCVAYIFYSLFLFYFIFIYFVVYSLYSARFSLRFVSAPFRFTSSPGFGFASSPFIQFDLPRFGWVSFKNFYCTQNIMCDSIDNQQQEPKPKGMGYTRTRRTYVHANK